MKAKNSFCCVTACLTLLLGLDLPSMAQATLTGAVPSSTDLIVLSDTAAQAVSHGLRREVYTDVAGLNVADLTNHVKFPDHPDVVDVIDSFEVPAQFADNYGARVSGFLLPPVTGDYVFYLTADDAGALFLSPDTNSFNKVLIANEPTWGMPRYWVDSPVRTGHTNISDPIHLEAGHSYYVEALLKEAAGGDNLAVTWQKPGDPVPVNGDPPIANEFLALEPVPLPNLPPKVALQTPQTGQIFTRPVDIHIVASANDRDGSVQKLEFFANERSLGVVTQPDPTPMPTSIFPPYYSMVWSNPPSGDYTLTAVATDDRGDSATSIPIKVCVLSPPILLPPTVTIEAKDPVGTETSPMMNMIDPAKFTVTRTGDTNQPLQVRYLITGTAVNGEDYQKISEYVTIPAGQYAADIMVTPIFDRISEGTETVVLTLTVPQIAIAGFPPLPPPYAIGIPGSAVVEIRELAPPPNLFPQVRVTQPCDGTLFNHPSQIFLTASATDSDGQVTEVNFFDGDVLIGKGHALLGHGGAGQNFGFAWTNPPAGDRQVIAKATDNQGATSASVSAHIIVNRPAANSELHVVGIYSGMSHGTSSANHERGDASVVVNRPGKSVILVLSSYEPVLWHVTVADGSAVTKLILSGAYPQAVTGLPENVETIRAFYDSATGATGPSLWTGYQVGTGPFFRSLATLKTMTGLEISSFQGSYCAPYPTPFTIDQVQDDPQLSSTFPEPSLLAGLPSLSFQLAFHNEGTNSGVFFQNYTLSGPEGGARLLPAMRVVGDAGQRYFYGTRNQQVWKVDSQTGTAQEMHMGAGVPELSWPMGIAYDSTRQRMALVSLGGEGFLYAYAPAQNQWSLISSMDNVDLDRLVYHASQDVFYGLRAFSGGTCDLIKLNTNGVVLQNYHLMNLPFGLGPGGFCSELVSLGDYLVLMLAPDPTYSNANTSEERMYLIDPRTGNSWLTYRKVPEQNQAPSIQIVSPQAGSTFDAGTTVQLSAHASDLDGWVKSVEFLVNSRSLGFGLRSDDCGAFVLNWTNPPADSYSLVARALDDRGAIATSQPAAFAVRAPNRVPSVTFLSPNSGDVFDFATPIEIHAQATDPDGWIRRVAFVTEDDLVINEQLFTGPSPQSSTRTMDVYFTWTNVSAGSHVLNAVVNDDRGAFAWAQPLSITVRETPPTVVTIAAPDPYASEDSADGATNTATFRIRRTGSTNQALTVWYSIHGSAVNGVDYNTIPGSLIIPAGKRAGRIVIAPINDKVPEMAESVSLRLEPSPVMSPIQTYAIGNPREAAAVIVDNDVPQSHEPPILPDGSLQVRFAGQDGLTYQLETSTNLTAWTFVTEVVASGGWIRYVEPQVANKSFRFYRVSPAAAPALAADAD